MRVRTSDLISRAFAVATMAAITLTAAPAADARPVDRDRDRLPDRWEVRHGMSVGAPDTFGNRDRDELFNHYELLAGTNPRRADSDRDGVRDGMEDPDRDGLDNAEEQYLGTHPRRGDSDRDGVRDGEDDADGDGVSNEDEFIDATDPLSACDDDEDLERSLRQERRLGRHFRSVMRWYPADLGYFDGEVDFDCDLGDEFDEDHDGDEFDGDGGDGDAHGTDDGGDFDGMDGGDGL